MSSEEEFFLRLNEIESETKDYGKRCKIRLTRELAPIVMRFLDQELRHSNSPGEYVDSLIAMIQTHMTLISLAFRSLIINCRDREALDDLGLDGVIDGLEKDLREKMVDVNNSFKVKK